MTDSLLRVATKYNSDDNLFNVMISRLKTYFQEIAPDMNVDRMSDEDFINHVSDMLCDTLSREKLDRVKKKLQEML